ncbi:MAG: hypothetical protein C0394_10135 [Syntrophus sp. (in: bacteria)]|nr:hypothetical protein [Syntrophus sp. (in: bacteria)]
MTPEDPFGIVLFESVSHALRAEKIIKAENIPCKLIPVPRQFSSDCGVCLRFSVVYKGQIERVLTGKLDFFEIALL